MTSKIDLLKKASENSFNDLYIDNKPKTISETQKEETIQPIVKEVVKEEVKQEDAPKIEVKSKQVKDNAVKESKNKNSKMLAFRIPNELNEDLDKYSYVARMTKQDVIIKAFEKFLSSQNAKDILSQYDDIKK